MILSFLKARFLHGWQAIPDPLQATVPSPLFRGFPEIQADCPPNCQECLAHCPTQAISCHPLKIDLGKCVFCGICEKKCKDQKIKFTPFHKTASTTRDMLMIDSTITTEKFTNFSRNKIKSIFGRSFKMRQVCAGGCNACEMELNATTNVNFDVNRYGFEFVASPRHADGLVLTGPISRAMAQPLEETWQAMPDPKLLIAVGTCAISGGLFADSPEIDRTFLTKNKPDIYIPGCPVHPLSVISAIISFLR